MTLFEVCMVLLLRSMPFRAYLAYQCLLLQIDTARREF